MAKKQVKNPVGHPRVLHPAMTKRFMIRCTPDDIEEWRVQSEKFGMTVGAWVRWAAKGAAAKNAVRF